MVCVPETALYEHHGPVLWQNNIGTSRQVLSMDPVPEATRMQEAPHAKLGQRILSTDT
jgi:hypothetical protein